MDEVLRDPSGERDAVLSSCRKLTDAVYDGLDLEREIRAVADQALGDTVLLWSEDKLTGFAICHNGAGTEAGSGACYVKFGAARPGRHAERDFDRLLHASEGSPERAAPRACRPESIPGATRPTA